MNTSKRRNRKFEERLCEDEYTQNKQFYFNKVIIKKVPQPISYLLYRIENQVDSKTQYKV